MLGLFHVALFLILPGDYLIPNAVLLFWRVEGVREADHDIRENRMKFKLYGYMAGHTPRDKAFTRLMKEQFDVEVEVIVQCAVEIEQVEKADAYNGRIKSHLGSRFGPHAIRDVYTEAEEWYQQPLGRQVLAVSLLVLNLIALRFVLKSLRGGSRNRPLVS